MLKPVKRAILRASKSLGIFGSLGQSSWRTNRLLIIGYHGVSIDDEHTWNPQLFISPKQLHGRLQTLRDLDCTVLPLGEALQRLRGGELPPRSVALTFDDGTADFSLVARPLLKKFGYPATVYLSTYYSSFNRPVFPPFCSYMLWKAGSRTLRARDLSALLPDETWRLGSAPERSAAFRTIFQFAQASGLSGLEKDDLARRIAHAVGVGYDDLVSRRILTLLTPEEVGSLAREGVDFQLHTHRHRTPVQESLFKREIEDNRRALFEMTGSVATHFCYPAGVYEPEFFPWLRDAGVVSATTCDTGIATPLTDPLLLPRLIDTMNLSRIEFESWLTGVGSFLPLRPHQTHH